MKKKVVWYNHHGSRVAVIRELKGAHQDVCLCYQCDLFNRSNRSKNCVMANLVYDVCVNLGIVTPVWECPKFENKKPAR